MSAKDVKATIATDKYLPHQRIDAMNPFEKETQTCKCNRAVSILLGFYGSAAEKRYTGDAREFDDLLISCGDFHFNKLF